MSAILTLNAGSSSIKFALYASAAEPTSLVDGQVENLGDSAAMEIGNAVLEIGPADHAPAVAAPKADPAGPAASAA